MQTIIAEELRLWLTSVAIDEAVSRVDEVGVWGFATHLLDQGIERLHGWPHFPPGLRGCYRDVEDGHLWMAVADLRVRRPDVHHHLIG
ncbi:MAG: hypothetical protein O3A37_01760 [Planctomycetota bacterium]|nr:hypothetical protein [Planctomycetota bacterium]